MKRGLVVGRFQPLHKGHMYLIKKALEYVDEITIVIGSTNVHDENNPFEFEERKAMLMNALRKHNLLEKIIKIDAVKDFPDDDVWLQEVLRKVGKFDIAFGNNDWTNDIFEKAGHKVKRVKYYNRRIFEGTKIRTKMRSSKHPEKIVEKYSP